MNPDHFIKRGTTPTILISIDGIKPESVESVEFIFKHSKTEQGKEICRKVFPGDDVIYDAENGCFRAALTDAETRAFKAGSIGYMDTRITLIGGTIPATEIAKFNVSETLFPDSSE